MTRHIADDFPAIRTRLASIRATEGAGSAIPRADPQAALPAVEPRPAGPARPENFYAWLGGLGAEQPSAA